MKFSVILPIYNVEKYLAECIESVLSQSFKDYELILVDDGSKDSSGRICDEYAQRDSRIKVFHKENGGQSSARNVGLEKASGQYIVYIDSDDFILDSSFLSDLSDKATTTQSDIILYKHVKYYDSSKKFDTCTYSLDDSHETKRSDDFLFELVKKDAYFGMAWTKAFRRRLAVDNHITFDMKLSCEDMDWYFNLVMSAETLSAIDKTYIAYRQREGSVTATVKVKNLVDFIVTLEKWSEKIQNVDISETKRKALMGALAKYYSNLLITYSRLTDKTKKQYKPRIKALSRLLDYSLSSRPQKIGKFYKLAGFGGVIAMLKIYDKIK